MDYTEQPIPLIYIMRSHSPFLEFPYFLTWALNDLFTTNGASMWFLHSMFLEYHVSCGAEKKAF